MTKTEALHTFFSGFGIDAYAATSVPNDVMLPYLTYEAKTAALADGEVSLSVNLWYYTDSEKVPNAKADEIGKAIGAGGVMLRCDDGAIWLKRGSPFCQAMPVQSDSAIKHRYLNITAEYITLN